MAINMVGYAPTAATAVTEEKFRQLPGLVQIGDGAYLGEGRKRYVPRREGGQTVYDIYLPTALATAPVVPAVSDRRPRDTEADAARAALDKTYGELLGSTGSEADIRAEQAKALQGRLNAVEEIARQRIAREEERGEIRLAEARALNVRGGTTGSEFAGMRSEEARRVTGANIDLIQAEKQRDILAVQDRIDARTDQLIETRRQQLGEAREIFEKRIKDFEDQAKQDVKTVAVSGVTLDEFKGTSDYGKLLAQLDATEFELDALFNEAKPQPVKLQWAWRGNTLVGFGQDPVTGGVISETYTAEDLGIPVGTDIATVTTDAGVFWYDKNKPLKEDGTPALVRIGGKPPTATEISDAQRQEDWKVAKQFIADNPDATPREVENALRERTKLTDADIDSLIGETKTFLSEDYFRGLFTADQLKAAAKEAGFTTGGFLGFGVGEKGINEYLAHIMGIVEQYRQAGLSDQEILKLFPKK